MVGAIGIAYGPAAALFIFTIATQPLRIIVMMSGMFFWLLSLLVSSLWWTIVPSLKEKLAFGLTFSILFQEIFRFFLYTLLSKAEAGLQKFSQTEEERRQANGSVSDTTKHEYAYVAGLGFGTMSGLFALINVLDDSGGPGTVGLRDGDSLNYLIMSAFFTMLMILLHVVWNVVFYWGLDTKRYLAPVLVVISHFIVSEMTLLKGDILYQVALPLAAINLVAMSVVAFTAAGGSIQTIIAASSCKRRQYRL
ncbi:putative gamma-secretase subunit Aph-1-like [Apostichopus japonicus]|uniref:Putative gamma-secretase subunit Aph-1-like n=1 Tax=Stichopus japonicus TaxID=307972 RepID=A0A2G8K6Q9_STIJA|nr:putative gamma-secretase subunit Aph-1-like [Apostichopus japonicus]